MRKVLLTEMIVIFFTSCVIDAIVPENIWHESDAFNMNNYSQLIKKEGRDFTILQLTDVHIGGSIKDTFAIAQKAIENNSPDILVLTGDNVIDSGVINTLWAERLIVFLDSFKTPYILAMGNHDGGGFSGKTNNNRKQIVADVFASGKYSLFDKGPVNIGGTGNYGVNILKKKGEVLFSIVVLDNGDNDFTANQLAWYEWYVKNLSESVYGAYAPGEGKVVKTIAVYHVPLQEMHAIRTELQEKDPVMASECFGETPSTHGTNSGMFTKMQYLKSTTLMLFGHDHKNMLHYQYRGIDFVYGLKTGPCAGYDKDKQGTTLITIKDDLTASVVFMHE